MRVLGIVLGCITYLIALVARAKALTTTYTVSSTSELLRALSHAHVSVDSSQRTEHPSVWAGNAHVLVLQHLDLSSIVDDEERGFRPARLDVHPADGEAPQALAIRGDCAIRFSAMLSRLDIPELHPRQCVLAVKTGLISVVGRDVWLHNLHVVLQSQPAEFLFLELVGADARVWHTRVGLQGVGGQGHLASVKDTATLFVQDGYLDNVDAYLPSLVSEGITALVNTTIVHNAPSAGYAGAIGAWNGSLMCVGLQTSAEELVVSAQAGRVYADDDVAVEYMNGTIGSALPLQDVPNGVFPSSEDDLLLTLVKEASISPKVPWAEVDEYVEEQDYREVSGHRGELGMVPSILIGAAGTLVAVLLVSALIRICRRPTQHLQKKDSQAGRPAEPADLDLPDL